MNAVYSLSKDVTIYLFGFLDPGDLISLSRVNKHFYRILLNNNYWNFHRSDSFPQNFSFIKRTLVDFEKIELVVREVLKNEITNLKIFFYWNGNFNQSLFIQVENRDLQEYITYIFFFNVKKEPVSRPSLSLFSTYRKEPFSITILCHRPVFDFEEKYQLVRRVTDEHIMKKIKRSAST